MSSSSTRSAIAAATREAGDTGAHMVSIGYLALTRAADNAAARAGREFEPWYRFFPWEDWREAPPAIIERDILPALTEWAAKSEPPETTRALAARDRVRFYFGLEGAAWDEERVLDRYELLYEAGLVEEARRDGRPAALARKALPALGELHAVRPPPHSRHRDRAAARQAEVPAGGV